ncbi:UDP-N-acetylmuramate--L-alanine ligase [Synechocystis sp. PCC 7509]|uniref:UDP-N-acetylmuramate--L-alanine ligase n=1 Tax=Synechocystis sp. PCC 7509 TaxID=927677 RepID=UPI0002AC6D97|nr:UDP-N-acetylmuramate--L-alanine ligase [Synechocystis sp. PCC 7509]
MPNSVDFSGKPFHFIGIGGIGMSALAYILAKRQLPVSGSDTRSSHITQKLQAIGAHIFDRQDANNLEFFLTKNTRQAAVETEVTTGAIAQTINKPAITNSKALPQVIYSTAINTANLEYKAALELGCPVFHRSDLLAALIKEYSTIAVAGTHGKTTTSSAIGYMLMQAGIDPTIVVGGEVVAWEGNARVGKSQYLVAEADESDGSLVKLSAAIGVVTNIELDHPDHYADLEQVVTTFLTFANRCEILVGCIDCETVANRLKPQISYSLQPTGADYTVSDIEYRADGTSATVWERGEVLGQLKLRLLGKHNLSNAIASVAVGRLLNLNFATIAQSLENFVGASRRFEMRGEAGGINFIDDYAHHPSEISATLESARLQVKPKARVIAIFQPHRYSRTQTFLTEFAESFQNADLVVITDIYSAGEQDLGLVSSQKLVELIALQQQVTYQPSLNDVSKFLLKNLRPGDIALFLGAGNLNQIIPNVISAINQISA